MLNGWGIYRPQPNSNLELKTVNSRNSGIRRLHLLTGAVAPPGRARRLSPGGCTSLSGAVAPPSLAQRLSPKRCHLSSQEVQPPDPGIPGFDRFELQIWTGLGPINTPPIQHWRDTDLHRILDLFCDSKSSNLCKVLKFSSFCSSSFEL